MTLGISAYFERDTLKKFDDVNWREAIGNATMRVFMGEVNLEDRAEVAKLVLQELKNSGAPIRSAVVQALINQFLPTLIAREKQARTQERIS